MPDDALDELRGWLLSEHWGSVDADRLTTITTQLKRLHSADVQGAVVELGCHQGAMALWIRAVLDQLGATGRDVHVYDSFRGLPAPSEQDSDHLNRGDLVADPAGVVALHRQWGKRPPAMHPGWFTDTLPNELPAEIMFAYLDGDLYDSILTSLIHCVPRIAPGGVAIVDDYADLSVNPRAWDGLPGVKKACDDYFGRPHPLKVVAGEGDLAFGLYRQGR